MFFYKILFLKYIQYFITSFLSHCTYTVGIYRRCEAWGQSFSFLLRLLKSAGWHAAQPSLWLAVLCGLKCLQLATAVTAFNFCWLLLLLPLFLLIAIRLCSPSTISALLLAFLHVSLCMSSASRSISYFIGKDWPCFVFSNQQEKSFSAVSQLITTCLV